LIKPIRTVRRFTNAINANDAWLSSIDAEWTTISLQRADTAGTVTLQQSVAARFPAENSTVPATNTARDVEFPKRFTISTETATTNTYLTLHKQSVSGKLSTYANVSAAASATTTTTAAAATAAASGLDHVPDIGQPERDTSLYTACPDRPELSVEWESTGVLSIIQS